MNQNLTSFFIKNSQLYTIENNIVSPKNECIKTIYEVVRVINSKVLFIEDHLNRFNNSTSLAEIQPIFNSTEILTWLKSLINKNELINGNIKFQYCLTKEGKVDFYAFIIPHTYPSEKEYEQGVAITLFEAERKNPNIKEENIGLREQINTYISEQKAYEALLIHSKGYITEGSKSNFFLIKENIIYTAPLNQVLEGITAKKILELCMEKGITVFQELIHVKTLKNYEAAFITGTSPKILPVKNIDSMDFNVKNLKLRKLMSDFDLFIEKYISLQ
jgi:branched-chain amino acid aminotransferase